MIYQYCRYFPSRSDGDIYSGFSLWVECHSAQIKITANRQRVHAQTLWKTNCLGAIDHCTGSAQAIKLDCPIPQSGKCPIPKSHLALVIYTIQNVAIERYKNNRDRNTAVDSDVKGNIAHVFTTTVGFRWNLAQAPQPCQACPGHPFQRVERALIGFRPPHPTLCKLANSLGSMLSEAKVAPSVSTETASCECRLS